MGDDIKLHVRSFRNKHRGVHAETPRCLSQNEGLCRVTIKMSKAGCKDILRKKKIAKMYVFVIVSLYLCAVSEFSFTQKTKTNNANNTSKNYGLQ